MTPIGRPRASSPETLAEAACELFLEQGYQATTASDIARRAGVSRSSFFNYFPAKDDVFWAGFDAHARALGAALASAAPGEAGARTALRALAEQVTPDALALGYANASAMGIEADLRQGAASRQAVMTDVLRAHLGADLHAAVRAGALAAALFAAVRSWASGAPGRTSLRVAVEAAFAALDG